MDALTRLPDHEAIAVLEELGSNDLSLVRNLPAYSTAQRSTSHAGLHHITSHAGLQHSTAQHSTCRPTSHHITSHAGLHHITSHHITCRPTSQVRNLPAYIMGICKRYKDKRRL